jgi:small-conductance mechanosensitive channel
MSAYLVKLRELVPSGELRSLIYAALIVIGGYVLARLARRFFRVGWLHPQQQLIIGRVLSYGVFGLAVTWALRELGVSLGALLGAAGILTVAIGFAAKTAASNLISGLFLMGERPFLIGDTIRVGDAFGVVVSIDLLSVKLRTFDNLLERIPNETLLKTKVTNLSRFPIRRADIKLRLPVGCDVPAIKKLLLAIADAEPLALEEPRPVLQHLGFGDAFLDVQFCVWAQREKFLELRTAINARIPEALAKHGIKLAPPQQLLNDGQPLEIRLLNDATVPPESTTEGP